MQKIILITLAFTVLTSCFIANKAEAEEKAKLNELQTLFMDADIIKNEQLDKGEFDIFHFRSFNQIDANKDGVLLINECNGACFNQPLWLGINTSQEDALADTIRKYEFIAMPYRFKAIDIDGDEQLTAAEYVSFGRVRFKYFDTDKNAMISSSEFCSGYKSSMPCDFSDNYFEFREAGKGE